MLSDINLDEIPNKDLWIDAATKVANYPDDEVSWKALINLTEYLPSVKLKNKVQISFFSSKLEKDLVILVYENFLVNFPFMEAEWIQYAQWHFKFSHLDQSIATFERALAIMPHSLVVWNAYLDLIVETNFDNKVILNHFERAREIISYHYHSGMFFDRYINFLESNSMICEKHLLLRRIIEIPQHDYLKYFRQFLSLIGDANLDTIKHLISKKDLKSDFNFTWIDLLDEKKFYRLKIDLKKKFTDLFITTQYNTYKFYKFEKIIKVHNNRTGDLNRLQLLNWKSYIEYVENLNLKGVNKEKEVSLIKNNTGHIDLVYNRCLIVTSSYQYFWIKYANYYLNYGNFEAAEKILLKGIYMNPVRNMKLRSRLVDLYILSSEFDKAGALVLELLLLLPHSIQFFCKLVEIEHFLNPSGVDKLITNKLNEIEELGNFNLEVQFDYLFIEILKYSSVSLTKLSNIFDKFKHKNSYFYIKAKQQFDTYYKGNTDISNQIPDGWICEYF